MDRPVAGRGQGNEHLRTIRHCFGDVVVAAGGASVHQLPRVASVEVRARRADLGAAVIAPCPHDPIAAELVCTRELNGVGAEANGFRAPPPGFESH